MDIPPGIRYLFKQLPHLVFPPLLVIAVSFLSQAYREIGLQWDILVILCLLSLPTSLALRTTYSSIKNHRESSALHATLPPHVGDWTPGSLITLWKSIRNFDKEYLRRFSLEFEVFGTCCFMISQWKVCGIPSKIGVTQSKYGFSLNLVYVPAQCQ